MIFIETPKRIWIVKGKERRLVEIEDEAEPEAEAEIDPAEQLVDQTE